MTKPREADGHAYRLTTFEVAGLASGLELDHGVYEEMLSDANYGADRQSLRNQMVTLKELYDVLTQTDMVFTLIAHREET
jgi:hypothetical protein